MIQKLNLERYSKVEKRLLDRLGDASLEWLYQFEKAGDRTVVYCDESLRDFMLIFGEINVFIVTNSQTVLNDFLKKLDAKKSYGFRCLEWMAPKIMDMFPPKEADNKGVILLTYSTRKNTFVKHSDVRYPVSTLGEHDANQVIAYSKCHWSPDFIREKIKEGTFYAVYQANEPISWLGTIWESKKACEIGFAFTKEAYRGKGLMKILTSTLTEKILQKQKIPILHTLETNTPAIRVAESLGYNLKAREFAYFYNL